MPHRKELPIATVAVLAMHAVLLFVWNQPHPLLRAASHFGSSPWTFKVQPEMLPSTPGLLTNLRTDAVNASNDRAAASPGVAPKPINDSTPPITIESAPPEQTEAPQVADGSPSTDNLKPAQRYYLPQELSARPTVREDSPPPQAYPLPDVQPQPVVVHLYINERGEVDDIILENSFLSDAAKQTIRDTFSAMRFHPGLIGAYPVRSAITVQVQLDSVQ